MGGLLEGKTILVTGIITDASIAFHVGEGGAGAGREGDHHRVRPAPADRPHRAAPAAAGAAGDRAGRPRTTSTSRRSPTGSGELAPEGIDGVVHSIAFSPRSGPGSPRSWRRRGPDISNGVRDLRVLVRLAGARRCCRSSTTTRSIVGMDFDPRRAMPFYNWMGVAKATLEAVNRYVAQEVGVRRASARISLRQARSRRWPRRPSPATRPVTATS